jgi:hypothetical protein
MPKEHVKFSIRPAEVSPYCTDAGRLVDIAEGPVKDIVDHLHSKNMSLIYIAHLRPKWGVQSKRLVFSTVDCVIGRSIMDGVPDKWRLYGDKKGYFRANPNKALRGEHVVLTEDIYSACKVLYATVGRTCPVALLGTRLSDKLLVELMHAKRVTLMLDGDDAGREGAQHIRKTLGLLGINHDVVNLPNGFDPKDCLVGDLTALCGVDTDA